MSFTTLLDTPFFTGAGGLSDQVPWPWPIAIDGHPFAIDLAHYSWSVPDMMRTSFDSSDRPGEGTFETKGVWRRIYSDWSLGAGQIYADPSTSDKNATRQFTSSLGLDPWTPRQLSFLPATERFRTGGSPTLLLSLGAYLYLVTGGLFERTTNPQAAVPTFQTVVSNLANIHDMTTDGNTVYIATTGAIWTHDSTAASPTVTQMGHDAQTYSASLIEWANGWLIAASGPELANFAADGTKTVILTKPTTGFVWTAVVGAPNAIYAGGQASDIGCIYSIALDPNTGGLGAPIYAGELPRGETLSSLAYYGTFLLIGTNKGFHEAQIGTGNALNIGPLIPTPLPVQAMCAEANFVWYSWSDYDNTHTGIGRANLGEDVDTLLPAYASDLMSAGSGSVTSIARFGEHTYFSVDGSGLYREASDGSVVATAECRFGRLEWGTQAAKTFLGAEIITEPLAGTFTATLEDETGRSTPIGGRVEQSTTGRGNLLGSGLGTNSNFYDLVVDFVRGSDTLAGPILRNITARALPMPTSTRTWQLPIVCTDHVSLDGQTSEASQSPKEIQGFFLNLRTTGRPVIYQEADDRHLVVVRSVDLPDGGATQWSHDHSAAQGTLIVTLASAEG